MSKKSADPLLVSRRAALLGSAAAIGGAATLGAGLGASPAAAQGAAARGATTTPAATPAGKHMSHLDHPGALGSRMRDAPAPKLGALKTGSPGLRTALVLPQPSVIDLTDGQEHALTIASHSYTTGPTPFNNLRVYDNDDNRFLMGPTIVMGQTGSFKVAMTNNLPLNPDQDQPHIVNIPSQFNTTNLHTHGLHVSPSDQGDNIYVEVLPKGTDPQYADPDNNVVVGVFHNIYDIKNHTPGTFWYHPHRHGSVAVQVASGAAGALIVKGGAGTVDAVPGIAGVTEKVLLLQQIVTNSDGELPDFNALWTGTATAQWTVNGTTETLTQMAQGEVQRWRVVNTGYQSEARFAVIQENGTELPVYLFAMDGVNFEGSTAQVNAVYLPPGGRADILVKAPKANTVLTAKVGGYVTRDANGPTAATIRAGFKINGAWVEAPFKGAPTTLFYVGVGPDVKDMPLPAAGSLPAPLVPKLTPTTPFSGVRYVEFDFSSFPTTQPTTCNDPLSYRPDTCPSFKFQINGELFCPGRVMFQPPVGTIDQYQVSSPGLHVFHIHVNPFLVTSVEGATLDQPMWRDTMLAGPGGYVALTEYTDYTGTFPIHCHILDHEDVGMMTNVTVVDPANLKAAFPKHKGH